MKPASIKLLISPEETIKLTLLYVQASTLIFLNKLGPNLNIILKYYANEKRFANECRFLDLKHKNVIQYHGPQQVLPRTLRMEYCFYGDFITFMEKMPKQIKSDQKLMKTFCFDTLQGLQYLHQIGVAHHDLKIDNLFVDENLILKIADFDLAFRIGDKRAISLGTKGYEAPELEKMHYSGVAGYDPMKADIYSLGITFLILISGQMPFSVDNHTKTIRRVKDKTKFLKEFINNDKLATILGDLTEKMCKTNPEERISLEEIRNHPFFKEEIYTDQERIQLKQKLVGTTVQQTRNTKKYGFRTWNDMITSNLNTLASNVDKQAFHKFQEPSLGEFLDQNSKRVAKDSKLVRTIFSHIIKELRSLRINGVTDLDINMDSIYIDENITLKIDGPDTTQGTPNFRAPEIGQSGFNGVELEINSEKRDIYSAGIILFHLVKGKLPFEEGKSGEFLWRKKKNEFFSQFNIRKSSKFANLFSKMCRENAEERIDINGVLNHPFLQGDTYSDEDFKLILMGNQIILDIYSQFTQFFMLYT